MELKLDNGSYVPAKYIGLERVGGADELRQRVTMKLNARRGCFLPLPEFGCRLHTLSSVKPSQRETAARQFVQEALSDEKDLVLDSLYITYLPGEVMSISADFTYGGDEKFSVNTDV